MTSLANYTIDDAQWATPPLLLGPGWNMLRTNGSNQFINQTQVDMITPHLHEFWNHSLSWTTTEGANTTIVFNGTDIWAYGMSGPDQGPYIALMDNEVVGRFTALAEETDFHYLLYAAHGLDGTKEHHLTLSNAQAGTSLAFDVALVTPAQVNSVPSALPSTAATSSSTKSLVIPTLQLQPPTMDQMIAAEEARLAKEWDPADLAQLAIPYTFHWSPSAYFVVVASALVGLLTIAFVAMFVLRVWKARRRKLRSEKVGTSYLTHRKPRPTTRIIEALKRGKISNPIPSDDGQSDYSTKKAGSSDGYREDSAHMW
ncbi:hypothetical protein BD324DRAFT_616087 [Kockovaella imperatae]|uniref:Uncharacterized protein n=1 Tax=Kockovaella imperatae TaxID=4999 RepID=A0A1Y1URE2_9TREE|nr:hypothetical protein BD324DRAFT_616087 [Kockovaella imperatae]ORX40054.1 hypothetical protein BD324DRAFT_616087 [Kockovaella imperatae]